MGRNNCNLIVGRESGGASVHGDGITGTSCGVGDNKINLPLIVTVCLDAKEVGIGREV